MVHGASLKHGCSPDQFPRDQGIWSGLALELELATVAEVRIAWVKKS